MEIRGSNLTDVAAQTLSTIFGRGCFLILQIFLARSLGPLEFGLYTLAWTVVGLVGTFAPLGMPQAILRYSIAGRHALSSAPIVVVTIVGSLTFVMILITAAPVAHIVFGDPNVAPAIVALAPSVPLLGVFGVMTSALRASHANVASAMVGALVFVLYLLATVISFTDITWRTPVVAGHMYTVAICLTLVPTACLLMRKLPHGPSPRLRSLMQFGFVTTVIHSANVLNLLADRIVIGAMADPTLVGIYQIASQMAVVVIVLRGAVTTVFEARVPKSFSEVGAPPAITAAFIAASRILLHLSTPGLICLALTAKFWINLLFGPDYIAAALPLSILLIGQLGLTFSGPAVTALFMTGEERAAMRLTIVTCLLNVVGNVALIPVFGLAGSAAVSGIANLLASGSCLWKLRHTGRLNGYFSYIHDIVIGTIACALFASIFALFLSSPSLLSMCGMLVGAYVVYGVVVAISCRVDDEVLEFLRILVRRVGCLKTWQKMP
jgi:O-antigen/teichoic acid export membrane protein